MKDERIAKWFKEGCSIKRIAAKLGNPTNIIRVIEGLLREKLITKEESERLLQLNYKD